MVKAVPFKCCGAYSATNVENWGESGLTVNPHTKRKKIKNGKEKLYANGERKQQTPEINNASEATLALPQCRER